VDEIYLDNNATTRPLEAVAEEVATCLREGFGNPSSMHARGAGARRALAAARHRVAALIGVEPEQVLFTSGATEANNMALRLLLEPGRCRRLITTAAEHSSILKTAAWLQSQGVEVTYLSIDEKGQVSPDALRLALGRAAGLVSIQWANSETGVVQPVEGLGALCREAGVPFHTDAAQAVGRLPIALAELPVDMLSFTGHKLHAPQGTGVLWTREPCLVPPLLHGGEQEGGLRAGTENLPGLVGLARAAESRAATLGEAIDQMRALRERFEQAVTARIPGLVVNGHPEERVCNTSNLRFPRIDGQALVAQLDREGILCSQTSACTSHRPEPSHVLLAMGLTEDEAYASVRFSFSVLNTVDEVDKTVEVITEVHQRLTRFMELTG